ncbi:MAG TPA: DNA repair protein RadC [Polyangiaceae bacterium]|jgi:DNA repair protein RadC|nr:DNA repair protein RadC [Polyangiaceae bacterium]
MPDLRERALAFGVQGLADVDLLTLLLGTGSAGESVALSAAHLLDHCGGLEGITRLGPHALARRGVGPAKATRIAAAVELGRRALLKALAEEREIFDCFEDVVRWARPRLCGLEHEEVWLLSLDGRYGLKSARRIAQGGLHGCALLTRDVLGPALRDGASAIVLIHNHPSGDPAPSPEDIAMTRAVRVAGELVGVPLIDHVVVARTGSSSLNESVNM